MIGMGGKNEVYERSGEFYRLGLSEFSGVKRSPS
jgi:hypothetical protein